LRSSRRTEVDEDYEIDELQLNEEDYELQFIEEDYDRHDDNEIEEEEQEQEKVITCRVGWLTKLVLKRVFCCLINSLNYLNQGLQGKKTSVRAIPYRYIIYLQVHF
jgi:hypothetical protein